MKMKVKLEELEEKKRRPPKIIFDGWKEGVYKVRVENSYHGYQTTSG